MRSRAWWNPGETQILISDKIVYFIFHLMFTVLTFQLGDFVMICTIQSSDSLTHKIRSFHERIISADENRNKTFLIAHFAGVYCLFWHFAIATSRKIFSLFVGKIVWTFSVSLQFFPIVELSRGSWEDETRHRKARRNLAEKTTRVGKVKEKPQFRPATKQAWSEWDLKTRKKLEPHCVFEAEEASRKSNKNFRLLHTAAAMASQRRIG